MQKGWKMWVSLTYLSAPVIFSAFLCVYNYSWYDRLFQLVKERLKVSLWIFKSFILITGELLSLKFALDRTDQIPNKLTKGILVSYLNLCPISHGKYKHKIGARTWKKKRINPYTIRF